MARRSPTTTRPDRSVRRGRRCRACGQPRDRGRRARCRQRSPPTRARSSAGRSSRSTRRSSGSRGRASIFRSWRRAAIGAAWCIGDARISLGRVPERTYDLLVLDAFSSDSIPIHLMTREALSLYLSRLAPDGVLVMHISNRHLRLAPIVARLAASQGLVALQQVESTEPGWPEGKNESHWIVMARDARTSASSAATTDGHRSWPSTARRSGPTTSRTSSASSASADRWRITDRHGSRISRISHILPSLDGPVLRLRRACALSSLA